MVVNARGIIAQGLKEVYIHWYMPAPASEHSES